MKIFHFSASTLQLTGEDRADLDPLDHSNWLVPAYATKVEPPAAQAGKTIHFVDGAWVYQDIPVPVPESPPEPPTPEQMQRNFSAAIQKRLDTFAQTRNYDSILSACTYATSTVAKFNTEGQACVNLRDATWAAAYDILAEVQAGKRPMPTDIADIEADLPAAVWPA